MAQPRPAPAPAPAAPVDPALTPAPAPAPAAPVVPAPVPAPPVVPVMVPVTATAPLAPPPAGALILTWIDHEIDSVPDQNGQTRKIRVQSLGLIPLK